METICHCVAGIHPVVRDPPRDTGWRSSFHTLRGGLNASASAITWSQDIPRAQKSKVTEYYLRGWLLFCAVHQEPIERAKAHWAKASDASNSTQAALPSLLPLPHRPHHMAERSDWGQVQAEVGRQQDCTVEAQLTRSCSIKTCQDVWSKAVRRQSILAGQFLLFLEQTFARALVAQIW